MKCSTHRYLTEYFLYCKLNLMFWIYSSQFDDPTIEQHSALDIPSSTLHISNNADTLFRILSAPPDRPRLDHSYIFP